MPVVAVYATVMTGMVVLSGTQNQVRRAVAAVLNHDNPFMHL